MDPSERARLRTLRRVWLGSSIALVGGYALFGPAWIELAYRGEAWGPLNRAMELARDAYPDRALSFWTGRAGRTLVTRLLVLGAVAYAVAALVLAPALRARVLGRVNSVLGEPSDPRDLSVLRIVVFGTLAASISPGWLADLLRGGGPIAAPVGSGWLYALWPPGAGDVHRAAIVLQACCVLAAAGLGTAVAAWAAVGLGVYVLGVPESFGKVGHGRHHLLWFAAVLAASPCADRLSLDAAWRARWRPASLPGPAPSVRYGFPLRLCWLLLGVLYFFPGFWKLYGGGVDWALGDNLRHLLHDKWFELEGWRPVVRVDRSPGLTRVAAVATVVWELGFLPALFVPPWRRAWLVGAFLFHGSIALFLRIDFTSLLVCFVAFADWRRGLAWLGARAGRPGLVDASPGVDPGGGLSPGPGPAVRAVGVALLAGNVALGLGHVTEGWPLTCYPTFAGFAGERGPYLSVEIESPTGETRILDRRDLRARLGLAPSVFRRNGSDIARASSPQVRRERLEALLRRLLGRGYPVEPGSVLAVRQDVFSFDPEVAERPLEQHVLGVFERTATGELRAR